MKQADLSKAILGGFVGTLVMTALLYLVPFAGGPRTDIAGLLGSLLGKGTPAALTGMWWVGMSWHFLNGTVIFPLIYAYLLYGWLPGDNWLRGLFFGLILWLWMEVAFMPVLGHGVFNDQMPQEAMRVCGALILNLVYGAILGAIAGAQIQRVRHVEHPA